MDDHADFDSVSWRNEPESDSLGPPSAEQPQETSLPTRISSGKRRQSSHQPEAQAGQLAGAVDLGGIGDGILECTVDSPLKENDGTKDAFVSYLITTTVGPPLLSSLTASYRMTNSCRSDRFQIISEPRILRSKKIHRFCLSTANAVS